MVDQEGWAPVVPDIGRPAVTEAEWYVAAIEQAFFLNDPPFHPDHAAEMDAMLDGYRGIGIDWKRIHAFGTKCDPTLPPMHSRYWSNGEPTVLALCGEAMRERIEHARASSASRTTTSRPAIYRGLGVPAKPIERAVDLADRLVGVEAKNAKLQRGIWGVLLGLLVLVVVALGTQQRWEKVDVPRQPATFRTEQVNTGEFRVTDDDRDPCYIGQDWTDCINAHVREFNQACTGRPLNYASHTNVCGPYENEILRMRQADQPGWVVETLGDFGHLTRTPIKKTQRVSHKDARPAVTHEAVCYLGFIGECPGPGED